MGDPSEEAVRRPYGEKEASEAARPSWLERLGLRKKSEVSRIIEEGPVPVRIGSVWEDEEGRRVTVVHGGNYALPVIAEYEDGTRVENLPIDDFEQAFHPVSEGGTAEKREALELTAEMELPETGAPTEEALSQAEEVPAGAPEKREEKREREPETSRPEEALEEQVSGSGPEEKEEASHQGTKGSHRVRRTIEKKRTARETPAAEEEGAEEKAPPSLPVATPPSPETPSAAAERASLLERLASARQAFVQHDYEKATWRKKLALVLGKNVLDAEEDRDLKTYRESYEEAVRALSAHELRELKKEGLSGDALEDRVESLLRYLRFDEALALRQAASAVRLERQNQFARVYEWGKSVGRRYNALPKKKKYLIIGGVVVGAVALHAAGGVLATAGTGLLLAKRLVSGAAVTATAEGLTDTLLDRREAKREEEAISEDLLELYGEGEAHLSDEKIAKLEAFLDRDRAALAPRLSKYHKRTYRKWLASGALGALVAFGAPSALLHHFGVGSEAVSSSTPARDAIPSARATYTPPYMPETPSDQAPALPPFMPESPSEPLFETDTTAEAPLQAPSGVPTEVPGAEEAPAAPGEIPTEASPGTPEPSAEVSVETPAGIPVPKELLREVAVSQADADKGLWGILEARLPENLPPAEKNRVILGLETLIQHHLDTATPEEAAAWGFPSGDINTIYPGSTLHLEHLLSGTDAEHSLPGSGSAVEAFAETGAQSSEMPVAAPDGGLAEAAAPSSEVPVEGDSFPAPEGIESGEALPFSVEESDPKAFYAEHPESWGLYKTTLVDLRLGIFQPNEMPAAEYAHFEEMARDGSLNRISAERVLKNYDHLMKDPGYEYSTRLNPLPLPQMERLHALTLRATAAFGEAGRVLPKERLMEYTARIATLATRARLANPAFSF
jgi:hypothetical protein